MEIMKALEKRDYIHSHLHQIDEEFINDLYQKMYSIIEEKDPIVGYDASGRPIHKSQFIADIKEAEAQIERGEYITIEDLEKESEKW
jgi:hypothetical protein